MASSFLKLGMVLRPPLLLPGVILLNMAFLQQLVRTQRQLLVKPSFSQPRRHLLFTCQSLRLLQASTFTVAALL
ncbi:hypothetical protein BCR33DRAFT_711665, partial [Rhizoclosmatium globosum]